MLTVVIAYPKDRLTAANIELPKDITFRFVEKITQEDIIEMCRDADCLLFPAGTFYLDKEILLQLQGLKLIQCPGAGFDHIDIEAANQIGIPVANVPGKNFTAVAELTVGFIIALQRNLFRSDSEIKAGNYSALRKDLLSRGLPEISGSRIGIIGMGAIRLQTAKILKMLNANVSYYSRTPKSLEIEAEYEIQHLPLDELLSTSDVVSLHIPLTDTSREMIGAAELARMKQGSFLINTARGEIVNQIELAKYLENGHLAGAAIDTIYPEPPEDDHPLLTLSSEATKRLILTPHTAGVTVRAFQSMMNDAFNNIRRINSGKNFQNIVTN